MFPAAKYVSFVVRLWCDDQEQPSDHWYSEVEHVQSGERWQFDSPTQSLHFVAQMAARLDVPVTPSPMTVCP
ncbi:MAG: hypothetical protein WAV60_19435 [Anaerolineae bacterium]